MYVTYRREYENFTHLPGESIDALFQRFTVVVNNMRANVDVLPYDDHDRAVKLLHSLDRTVWGGKYINDLCVTGLSLKDDFCGMARSSSSKRSQKDASDLDSEDEVCDELSSLRKENEELVDLLDNRDHMLREAKKLRKELRAFLEDARTRVAELETQVLDGKLEIDSLKTSLVVSDEVDCADCSVFLADLTDLREKHASKCEELDVLRVELAELQSRPTLLGVCTS
jgi:hypothetical protein